VVTVQPAAEGVVDPHEVKGRLVLRAVLRASRVGVRGVERGHGREEGLTVTLMQVTNLAAHVLAEDIVALVRAELVRVMVMHE